ncbi:MAG: glucose-6-phosphate isomerase, partial [Kordiimonas sp.]
MSKRQGTWEHLEKLAEDMKGLHLKQLFAEDTRRFDKYSLQTDQILFDYSKNLITDDVMSGLLDLAKEVGLSEWREKMFSGGRINMTEDRPVLHVALRNRLDNSIEVDGVNVMDLVGEELRKMEAFVGQVRSGEWRGYSGKRITDVVNIGIGGSNLGPQMVTEALSKYSDDKLRLHYVSNVDRMQIAQVLRPLDPKTVLFVVSSKTFTTRETLTNAKTARNWLFASSFDETVMPQHFVAVTANRANALEFGLP